MAGVEENDQQAKGGRGEKMARRRKCGEKRGGNAWRIRRATAAARGKPTSHQAAEGGGKTWRRNLSGDNIGSAVNLDINVEQTMRNRNRKQLRMPYHQIITRNI